MNEKKNETMQMREIWETAEWAARGYRLTVLDCGNLFDGILFSWQIGDDAALNLKILYRYI